ncbi:uncharacterized protein LOC128709301 [Anopheles marshallii]|uniref:uncharacterized protein LOC128709301 n=1 Tax=Anopheles marshallii TaxID=1521116 RepID=UPI00237AB65A|nr:uncharacterized protein LOC128709301 [Anopheles marshallii]
MQRCCKTMRNIVNFIAYLNKALRNQFVFGLQNKAIQTRLMEEKELTWEKARTKALAKEATQKGIEIVRSEAADINFVEKSKTQEGKLREKEFVEISQTSEGRQMNSKWTAVKCYRCGSDGHVAYNCRHVITTCPKCNKVGHLHRVLQYIKQNGERRSRNQR